MSKLGRNQPCPCGSGRKFKKCCGRPQETASIVIPADPQIHTLDDIIRLRHAALLQRMEHVVRGVSLRVHTSPEWRDATYDAQRIQFALHEIEHETRSL